MTVDVWIYLGGWTIGWLLLARPRRLERHGRAAVDSPPAEADRDARHPAADGAIAVIVPARNEEVSLPTLLDGLVPQLRDGDQLVVVDDHSTDRTAEIARASGAQVVDSPAAPPGWLGKPNACWFAVGHTTAPTLLFLDADVQPSPSLLDDVRTAVADHPAAVVSAQPHHHTERGFEQASALFNVVALMATGACTPLGRRAAATLAFGPVLAVRRETYLRIGGHANERVRGRHTEDLALARAVGSAEVFTSRTTSFRMHPDGWRQMVRGWTRSIATGAGGTAWWATALTAAWVWSLAGGVFATWWAYPLSAIQLWWLYRIAGRFRWWTAVVYPLGVAVFTVIVIRGATLLLLRRNVTWKDRAVPSR